MVGSLLRTAPLKEARAKREKAEINPDQLKAVEDDEIEKIIKKQEEVGPASSRPTASSAARGGISISSGMLDGRASSSSSTTASSSTACRPSRESLAA